MILSDVVSGTGSNDLVIVLLIVVLILAIIFFIRRV